MHGGGPQPLGSSMGLLNLSRSSLVPVLGPTVWNVSAAPAPKPQPFEAFPFRWPLPGSSLVTQPLLHRQPSLLSPPAEASRRRG